jgi:hypothetical protein
LQAGSKLEPNVAGEKKQKPEFENKQTEPAGNQEKTRKTGCNKK